MNRAEYLKTPTMATIGFFNTELRKGPLVAAIPDGGNDEPYLLGLDNRWQKVPYLESPWPSPA